MTAETLLLIGRGNETTFDVHAGRLRERGVAETVEVATYRHDPTRELRDQMSDISGDVVYVVPMSGTHTTETTEAIPTALSGLDGAVHYCDPVGCNPAVTGALIDRAKAAGGSGGSIALVGLGSAGGRDRQGTVEFHAQRIRARSGYDEVLTCYLMRNPAVECVRYNVSNDRAVAVPVFVSRGPATEHEIPERLELSRGGLAYADPLGGHERVTAAVESILDTRRALVSEESGSTARARPSHRRLATDGDGRPETPGDI